MKVLPVIFIVSLPSYVIYISFSSIFWGYSIHEIWKRILLFAVIESIYMDMSVFLLQIPYFFLNSIVSFFLLFFFIFRSLSWGSKIKISAFSFVVGIANEGISGIISSQFIPRDEFLNSPALLALIIWPGLLLVGCLSVIMAKQKFSPGKQIYEFIQRQRKKNISLLLFFLFFQFIIFALVVTFRLDTSQTSSDFSLDLILYFSALLSIVIIYVVLRVISQTKDDAVRMTQQIYIDDVNQMFTTIRGQRHDFLNHVQVILSFVKRGKIKELEKYTQELVGEITEINEIIQIGHPALAALIQAKILASDENKIRFDYQFSGLDHLSLGVKSIDIVKISGNLIDNSFDEVMHLPQEDRWVEIHGWIAEGNLYLTVRNPGKLLSEEEKELIFFPGYSTKSDNTHCGIGLSIVKERVEHYKGNIDILSSETTGIQFKVKIPLGAKFGYTR